MPLIERTDGSVAEIQGVVLCPTRELCLQINREMEQFSRYRKDLRIVPVYGGKDMGAQIRSLKERPHILVATPGRLADMIRRKLADLSHLKIIVLDEADIMLNMGFREELDFILGAGPETKQTLLFSATMPPEVARIASEYMDDPIEVSVGKKNAGTETIEHYYYLVHAKDRYKALKRLVDFYPGIYGLIFCRTRADTQMIADKMLKDGYNVDALHGDMTQQQREYVMKKFREQSLELLVATDIAARGLDVNNLTHVIHYELPDDIESYNHRSGRTGRAGRRGTSCAIVNMREKYKIRRIEKILGRKILEAPVPLGEDICEQQLMHLIDRVQTVDVDEEQIAPYLGIIEDKLRDLDRGTLLKHFISLEFNRFLGYYGSEEDLQPVRQEPRKGRANEPAGRFRERDDRDKRGVRYVRMNLNLGHRDRISPQHIISLINRSTQGNQVAIGRIDIGPTKSSVQVDAAYTDLVEEALRRVPFGGKRLKINMVRESGRPSGSYQKDRSAGRKGGPSNGKKAYGERKGGKRKDSGRFR